MILLANFIWTTGILAKVHSCPTPAGAINRAPTFSGNKLPEDMPMKGIRSKTVYSSSDGKRVKGSHQLPDLSGEKVGARFIAPVSRGQTSAFFCPVVQTKFTNRVIYHVRCTPTTHHRIILLIIISSSVGIT